MSVFYEVMHSSADTLGKIVVSQRDGVTYVWLSDMFEPIALGPGHRAEMQYFISDPTPHPVKFRCDVFREERTIINEDGEEALAKG